MDVLRQYALVKQPAKQISSSVLLANTDSTITIFDAFPKARYHFLCLPRLPFLPFAAPSTQGAIPIEPNALDSLATLLRLPANVAQMVLVDLKHAADEAKEMINDEMLKTEGFVWDVNVGFHSSPSMRHLHLHVISSDLVSERLKHKHHYNSFRPDVGFFVHLNEVASWFAEDTSPAYAKTQGQALQSRSMVLKLPLSCYKCGQGFAVMPALKSHLEAEWREERRQKAKR